MTSSIKKPHATGIPALWGPLRSANLSWPWGGLISLVLMIQMALIWTHIPWADELQATALARESHSISDWYWNFRYEGHPPLWHLLLKLPLAFTDDSTALKIVQSLVVLCTAALLHLRAPFTPGVKFLLSLNYFLFFEYGVIARGYSLTVLFFFGAIAYRQRPLAWLFIALLPQGGLQSMMLAGICGLIVLREQGWRWGGVLLAFCGGLVALIWMWPAADAEPFGTQGLDSPLLARLLWAAYMNGSTFLPVDFNLDLTGWELLRMERVLVPIGIYGPIYTIYYLSRKSPFMAWMLAGFTGANLILTTKIYVLTGRHFGLWVVLMIGFLWVIQKRGEPLTRIVQAWMIMLALGGAGAAIRQTMTPFSPGPQVVSALREIGEATPLIIPVPIVIGAEIHGLLRIPTYDMPGGCMQSFIRWRRPIFMGPSWIALDPERRKVDLIVAALDELKAVAARAGGQALLLFDDADLVELISERKDPALTLLREIKIGKYERLFRAIYRLDVPPDPNPTPIPPCVR
jgi:hypothetical protein